MKKKITKICFNGVLFYALLLFYANNAFGSTDPMYWGTKNMPLVQATDRILPIFNFLNMYILSPLLILGLAFYVFYLYKIIIKKDAGKRKKFFKIGTLLIFIDILIYVLSVIIVTYILTKDMA